MDKKYIYMACLALLMIFVSGFGSEISYIGIDVKNSSDILYNNTYTVTSYIFDSGACSGTPDATGTSTATFTEGNGVVTFNYTSDMDTFYIQPSIEGYNHTCFLYTASAQSQVANNATDASTLTSYGPGDLPIAGDVTGTLAASSVTSLDLNTIIFSNLFGFNNLTKCSGNQILAMNAGGTAWECDTDSTNDQVASDELDGVCGTDDRVLRRVGGTWGCFDDSVYYDDTDTDTNESARFNALTATDCDADYLVIGINDTGGVKCAADQTGAGAAFDLNITSDSGSGTIEDNEIFTFTGAGAASTAISGNELTITCTDTDTTYTNASFATSMIPNDAGYWNDEGNITCTDISGLSADLCDGSDADTTYSSLSEFDNDQGFFSSISNFTDTLTDAKWCVYASGTGLISCNVDPVSDTDTDTTTNVTAIQVTGTTTKKLSVEQTNTNGLLTNLTATWTDIDTDTTYSALSEFSDDVGFYHTEANLTALLNDNYVDVAGDTMTGALVLQTNATTEKVIFEKDTTNHMIYDNTTCIIIKGDTGTLEIC